MAVATELRRPGRHVGSGELLAALADDAWGPAGIVLDRCGVGVDAVIAGVAALERLDQPTSADAKLSPVLSRILRSAIGYAPLEAPVTTEHLLMGLLDEPDSVAATIFSVLGVGKGQVLAELYDIDSSVASSDGDCTGGDGDLSGGRTPCWVESIKLEHPPALVWALIESREHAQIFEGVMSGVGDLTEHGGEAHEGPGAPEGRNDEVVTDVVYEALAQRARISNVAIGLLHRWEIDLEVEPASHGSLLRVTYVLNWRHSDPGIGLMGRRHLGRVERMARALAREYAGRVQSELNSGWAPAGPEDDDESQ